MSFISMSIPAKPVILAPKAYIYPADGVTVLFL